MTSSRSLFIEQRVLSEDILNDIVIPGNGCISVIYTRSHKYFLFFISNNINIQTYKNSRKQDVLRKYGFAAWFCEAACCGLVDEFPAKFTDNVSVYSNGHVSIRYNRH